MATSLKPLQIRRALGNYKWSVPVPFGPDGWFLVARKGDQSVIVSCAEIDGVEWVHASMTGVTETPSYEDLALLHKAVWGDNGYSYQCFVPTEFHVNYHVRALHLWGRLDGKPVLPEFSLGGMV